MSSTNRGGVREASDYYVTPEKPVIDFLKEFIQDEGIDIQNLDILDPCAGGDEVGHDMTYPHCVFFYGADYNRIETVDIREDSAAHNIADFLTWETDKRFDLVITNPPFAIAQSIIEKSLTLAREGGYVVMLLRLNYVGSKGREKFWKDNPPYAIYAHNKRMSFTDNGKTDSIEYAHFVWKKGVNNDHARFKILFS